VSLEPLTIFARQAYAAEIAPFAEWLTRRVSMTEVARRRGWLAHLHAYRWSGDSWQSGLVARASLTAQIRQATTRDQFEQATKAITAWGGIRTTFSHADLNALADSLPLLARLRDGAPNWQSLYMGRIASTSKIYAAYEPEFWAIYDSRVAAALGTAVHRWWREKGEETTPTLLRFPWPGGRLGGPPDGFPRLGGESSKQGRLAFIYASWLMAAVLERLREAPGAAPPGGWRLVHVEMVLFMLGAPGSIESLEDDLANSRSRAVGAWEAEDRMAAPGPGTVAAAGAVAKQAASKAKDLAMDHGGDAARSLLEERRLRRKQMLAALRYAEQTRGELAFLQFSDGVERWIVYHDGHPVVAFPEFSGALDSALAAHRQVECRTPLEIQDSMLLHRSRHFVEDGVRSLKTLWRAHGLERQLAELASHDPRQRRAAAENLGARHGSAAVGPLVHALRDSNAAVREAAASALGKCGDALADKPLVQTLTDRSAAVRGAAALALGQIHGDDGIDSLLAILYDENEKASVRACAAEALGELDDVRAVGALSAALCPPEPRRTTGAVDVRVRAAVALGRIGTPATSEPLVKALQDDSARVRSASVKSLGQLGGPMELAAVENALRDADRTVAKDAYAALSAVRADQGSPQHPL
jgi:HEAT repeat protein